MKRIISIPMMILFIFLSLEGQAINILKKQVEDSLIKVTGVITSTEDNLPIKAKVFYEKLPYYDDMGFALANKSDGKYQMNMILGTTYSVIVSSDGFDSKKSNITVNDDGNGGMTFNVALSPDFANKKFTIENLTFSRGRSVISTSSYAGLDEFANWLRARPDAIVQLEGHTDLDSRGNAPANLKLSEDRVEAVKSYLIKKGIKKNRLRTKAFGGTQPITKERTTEARALNRRVEVRIIQQ